MFLDLIDWACVVVIVVVAVAVVAVAAATVVVAVAIAVAAALLLLLLLRKILLEMQQDTVETLYSTIYYSQNFIELNIDKSTQYMPFELTKDTPYLALSGELWSVFYEYFNRNWSRYKGFLL